MSIAQPNLRFRNPSSFHFLFFFFFLHFFSLMLFSGMVFTVHLNLICKEDIFLPVLFLVVVRQASYTLFLDMDYLLVIFYLV